MDAIKRALGIQNVFTETCAFRHESPEGSGGFQIEAAFRAATNTKKNCFTTLITNHPLKKNEYALEAIDVSITISELL